MLSTRRSGRLRSGIRGAAAVLLVIGVPALAAAQQYPLWERLLRHYGGVSDQTPVPSMRMGHMQMSLQGEAQPGDAARAQQILATAGDLMKRYADVNVALREGYKPFHPTGRIGEEVHYTNYRYARREQHEVDYTQPGSLLYERTSTGMKVVGVMYIAPRDSTPQQLNAVVPLSTATWHRHVDFCGGPRSLPVEEQFGPNALFGFRGSIHDEQACKAADGLWIPVVFGWMTHVYPDRKDPWGGMDMDTQSNADST
jgi:hypothetical protein